MDHLTPTEIAVLLALLSMAGIFIWWVFQTYISAIDNKFLALEKGRNELKLEIYNRIDAIDKTAAETKVQAQNSATRIQTMAETLSGLAVLPTQVAAFTGKLETDVEWIKDQITVMQAHLLRQQQ